MIPIALQGWQARWSLPHECLADLLATMGAVPSPPTPSTSSRTSEAYVQSLVRLEAPRYGVWLTRNNVGARKIVDEDGQERFIRWGLANESKQQNDTIKSGDLIGIRPVAITPAHVGYTIGQFVSIECKHVGWSYKGDAHELAQLNWQTLVTKYGGYARFATGEGAFG